LILLIIIYHKYVNFSSMGESVPWQQYLLFLRKNAV